MAICSARIRFIDSFVKNFVLCAESGKMVYNFPV